MLTFLFTENREELVKSSNSVYPFDFPDGKYRNDYFAVYHLIAHDDMPAEDTFQYALVSHVHIHLINCLPSVNNMFISNRFLLDSA